MFDYRDLLGSPANDDHPGELGESQQAMLLDASQHLQDLALMVREKADRLQVLRTKAALSAEQEDNIGKVVPQEEHAEELAGLRDQLEHLRDSALNLNQFLTSLNGAVSKQREP